MRWERLFDDLEAQLAAADAQELSSEIAERTRIELGRQTLSGRLKANLGTSVTVRTAAGHIGGVLLRAGSDVVLIQGPADPVGQTVVALGSVIDIVGLGRAVVPEPDSPAAVAAAVVREPGLRQLLRAVAIDRAALRIQLTDGSALTGTLDMVGADHIELAEHALDQPRRATAVKERRLIPLSALAVIRQI